SIDFAAVTNGCGLAAWRLEHTADAREVLATALAHDGPALVECMADPLEAPYGETLKPGHAEKTVTAYDAVTALAVCREHDVPVLPRDGGTSLAGQCCNAAVVLDWSKYCTGVDSVDTADHSTVVEPGVKLDGLNSYSPSTNPAWDRNRPP